MLFFPGVTACCMKILFLPHFRTRRHLEQCCGGRMLNNSLRCCNTSTLNAADKERSNKHFMKLIPREDFNVSCWNVMPIWILSLLRCLSKKEEEYGAHWSKQKRCLLNPMRL